MSTILFILTISATWTLGAAVRMEEWRDAEETVSNATQWKCPDECQQCCTAHSWDMGLVSWGVSESQFKCILMDHTKTPDPKCEDVESRTHANKMYKTKCPFPSKDGEPWKDLEKTPCSQYTKCCCDSSDDWTEHVCLDAKSDHTEAFSTHANANDKIQQYEKTYQAYTNDGECVGDVTALLYEMQKGIQNMRAILLTGKSKAGTHGKCCVETEQKSKKEMISGSCRLEGGYPCDEMMCAADSHCGGGAMWCGQKQVCDYKTITWTACKKFQTLFYCAKDKVSTTQTRYKRVSTQKGVCVGDKSNPALKESTFRGDTYLDCPAGFSGEVTGHSCRCEGHCGASR